MRAKHKVATRAPEPDARFTSVWTNVRGLRIHSRESLEAPLGVTPVVLVHGLAVSHRYLMPVGALLSSRYPVRAIDLPGFGLSDDVRTIQGVPELADWLADWLKASGNVPVDLLGNSFGTQIAVDLAARYPELVRKLVLVGPTMDPRARTMPRQVLRWLRELPFEDPGLLPILLRDLADAGLVRAVRTFRAALRDPIEQKLPDVTAPALVTRGEHEAVASQRWTEEIVRLLQHGELAVVPGSPHDATYTAASALAAITIPFLDRDPD